MDDTIPQRCCKVCHLSKPLTDFYDADRQKHKPPEERRKQKACKQCVLTSRKAYQQLPERKIRHQALQNIRRNRQREKYRNEKLGVRFGINLQEYEEMFKAQGGVCAICKKPEESLHHITKEIKRLAVDHDHKTGKIRGLLCFRCNTFIGRCEDDVSFFSSIVAYLTH